MTGRRQRQYLTLQPASHTSPIIFLRSLFASENALGQTSAIANPSPAGAPNRGSLAFSSSPLSLSQTTPGSHGHDPLGGPATPLDGDAVPPSSDGDATLQQQQQQQMLLARVRAQQDELERRVLATPGGPGETSGGGVPALLAAVEAGLRLREETSGGSADRSVIVFL